MIEIYQRLRPVVDFLSGLSIIAVAAVIVWKAVWPAQGAEPTTLDAPIAQSVDVAGTHVNGDPAAPVMILEYADFECAACLRFATGTMRAVVDRLVKPGRASFGFKHFPLPNHRLAQPAAIAAECAGQAGKFWPFYKALFDRDGSLGESILQEIWKRPDIALSPTDCRLADAADVVRRHSEEAVAIGIRGTPTFFVGTVVDGKMSVVTSLYGVRPIPRLRKGRRASRTPHGELEEVTCRAVPDGRC